MYVPTNPKIFWLFFSHLRSSWIDQHISCLPIWCDGLANSCHRSHQSDLQLDTKTLLYTKTVYDHDIFIYLKGEVRNWRSHVLKKAAVFGHKLEGSSLFIVTTTSKFCVWKTSQSRYAKIIKELWGVLLKPHFSNWSKSLTWRIIRVAYMFIKIQIF